MNRAVIAKTLREAWPLALAIFLGIVAFEALYVRAVANIEGDVSVLLDRPFIARFVNMLAGADVAAYGKPTGLVSVGFAHPLLFALMWTFLITTATRFIAGEIDRGTADLLLALPVSRWAAYSSMTVVLIALTAVLAWAPWIGVSIGERFSPLSEPLELRKLVLPCVGLTVLSIAIGCGTMLLSALCSRRGWAVAIVVGILLASFLVDYLSNFWTALERFNFLTLLHYYKPLVLIRSETPPWGDWAVLITGSVVTWTAGLIYFMRRDIPGT